MAEIQQLSALRRALKAEFESIGLGGAVAGMQTLTGFVNEMPHGGAVPSAAPEGAGAFRGGEAAAAFSADHDEEEAEEAEARLGWQEEEVEGAAYDDEETEDGYEFRPLDEPVESEPAPDAATSERVPVDTDRMYSSVLPSTSGPAKAPAALLQWGPPGMVRRAAGGDASSSNTMSRLEAPRPQQQQHLIQQPHQGCPLSQPVATAQAPPPSPPLHPLQQLQHQLQQAYPAQLMQPPPQSHQPELNAQPPQWLPQQPAEQQHQQAFNPAITQQQEASMPFQWRDASEPPQQQDASAPPQWLPPRPSEQHQARQAVAEALQQLHPAGHPAPSGQEQQQQPFALQPPLYNLLQGGDWQPSPSFQQPSQAAPAAWQQQQQEVRQQPRQQQGGMQQQQQVLPSSQASGPPSSSSAAASPMQWTVPLEQLSRGGGGGGQATPPRGSHAEPSPSAAAWPRNQPKASGGAGPSKGSGPSPMRERPSPMRERPSPQAAAAGAGAGSAERPLVNDGSYAQVRGGGYTRVSVYVCLSGRHRGLRVCVCEVAGQEGCVCRVSGGACRHCRKGAPNVRRNT